MSTKCGPNIVTDGLVFGYDADDRHRFYKGEPTTNYIIGTGYGGDGTNQEIGAKGGVEITDENLKYNGLRTILYTPGTSYNWYTHSTNISSSTSTVWTFSCYIKRDDGGTLRTTDNLIMSYMYYPTSDGADTVSYQDVGNGWYRVYRTRTGTDNVITLVGLTSLAPNHKFYISGWILEKKSHTTQFTQTTRSVTESLIDLKRNTTIDVSNISFDSTAHPVWIASDTNCMYAELGYTLPIKITIETVFSPTLLGGWQCVVHRSDTSSIGSSEFWIGLNISNNYITGTIGAKTGVSGTYNAGITNIVPVIGKYYHVISTWDGSNVRTYVNGELKKTYALSIYSLASDPTIRFAAADDNGSTYPFNGKIPISRLYWNKSFTEQEVQQNYNAYKKRFNI